MSITFDHPVPTPYCMFVLFHNGFQSSIVAIMSTDHTSLISDASCLGLSEMLSYKVWAGQAQYMLGTAIAPGLYIFLISYFKHFSVQSIFIE